MMTRDYDTMRQLIESAKGRFCCVDFIKRDGTMRRMVIQPASLKFHIKGDSASDRAKRGNITWKANNPNLMPVWDIQAEGIRSINFDTITRIKLDGETYEYA